MEKRYYIAYGSNLNIPQMRMRCPGARIIGTSVIEATGCCSRAAEPAPTSPSEPQEGASVPVAAWAVTEEDEAALDRYEGFPTFTTKRRWSCPSRGSRPERCRLRKVFVYIMHEDRPLGAAERFYMETCRQGYRSFGFDEAFLERAYADSEGGEFPGGWKNGDACFMVTNRKNGCTGNYTVLGVRWEIFLAPEQQGQPLPRIRRADVPQQGGGASGPRRRKRKRKQKGREKTDNVARDFRSAQRCEWAPRNTATPAVSRADGKTLLCPDCGTGEAPGDRRGREGAGTDPEAIHRVLRRGMNIANIKKAEGVRRL